MALNFTAGQYEKAFSPTKLCNWGVAKKSVQPKKLNDVTKIIVDERGHLLPGLRRYTKNPWAGLFHNTYHLPRKITRKRADDMAHGDILSSWEKRSAHVPVIAGHHSSPKLSRNYSSVDKENEVLNDTDSPKQTQHAPESVALCRSTSPSICSNKSSNILQDIKNHPKPDPEERKDRGEKSETEPILSDVFTNELVAKNLRLSNQKHHRLPDAVDNPSYNALQMKRDSNPGLALNVDPQTSAIGCKVFHSPGPTQCSKLKVFRPRTATTQVKKHEESDRPKTTSRIKMKSKPLSEMDLAIYWDIPASTEMKNYENPAPAVFQIVPADDYRKEVTDAEVPSLIGSDNSSEAKVRTKKQHTNPSAVMDVVNADSTPKPVTPSTTDRSVETKKESPTPSIECPKLSKRHSSASSLNSRKSHDNGVPKNESANETKIFDNCPKLAKTPSPPNSWDGAHKRSKSSPNLANVGVQVNGTKLGRPCVACDVKRHPTSSKIERDPYKSAFKAGKLNNYKVDNEVMERIHKSKHLRVPKPKTPFARKNYSIGTLAPPFSIWPRTRGYDYPDHWRLASVYQHSYKPLEARKGPLIKTVFQ